MSIAKGSVSLTRLQILGPVPTAAQVIEALRQEPCRPFEDGSDEERFGICDFRNYLKGSPKEEDSYTFMDGKVHFGVQQNTRKVPASELEAILEFKLESLAKEQDLAFVGKEMRISLKDEIKADLLKKQRTVSKVTQAIWNLKEGLLLVAGGGKKPLGLVMDILHKRFGAEARSLDPVNLASQLLGNLSEDQLLRGQDREVAAPMMGQAFLAWLWRRAVEQGGTGSEEDSTCVLLLDPMKLVGESGAVKEVTLKKGEPVESRAAMEALVEGMLPASLKLRLLQGDLEWIFTLDQHLQISGLNLPKTNSKDMVARLADRTFLVEEACAAIDSRFKTFLQEVWVENYNSFLVDLKTWAVNNGIAA